MLQDFMRKTIAIPYLKKTTTVSNIQLITYGQTHQHKQCHSRSTKAY